jgi:phospholipase C
VCSDVFDHTSMLRFLETRFGIEVPNLSRWRRETCGDLTATLGPTGNDSKPDLPSVSLPRVPDALDALFEVPPELLGQPTPPYPAPAVQSMPGQEAGTRRRRR